MSQTNLASTSYLPSDVEKLPPNHQRKFLFQRKSIHYFSFPTTLLINRGPYWTLSQMLRINRMSCRQIFFYYFNPSFYLYEVPLQEKRHVRSKSLSEINASVRFALVDLFFVFLAGRTEKERPGVGLNWQYESSLKFSYAKLASYLIVVWLFLFVDFKKKFIFIIARSNKSLMKTPCF